MENSSKGYREWRPTKVGRPGTDITGQVFGNVTAIRRAYLDNKGHIVWECRCICGRSIGSTYNDLRRGRNQECKKCSDSKSKLSPLKSLYGNYRRGAEQRNLDFDISIDEFHEIIKMDCYYCGSPPIQVLKKEWAKYGIVYNGIDRKDNSIGYTLLNVVPCCKFCNFAKSTDTLENFEAWLQRVRNNKSVNLKTGN